MRWLINKVPRLAARESIALKTIIMRRLPS
jgi:hypothetical protein